MINNEFYCGMVILSDWRFICHMTAIEIAERAIKESIIEVNNFPVEGVSFKDITPLFEQPSNYRAVITGLTEQIKLFEPEAIVGLESRGFLFGFAVAVELNLPFIMARKKGKLPRAVYSVQYELEYGHAELEIHNDSIKPDQKILIHDDVLATGGTAEAAARLVAQAGGVVCGFSFVMEILALNGGSRLAKTGIPHTTLARF
jgi:adenine phosphoribosyltransferase